MVVRFPRNISAMPIRIVVFCQEELKFFPSLTSWLTLFNIDAHHVINICLLKPELVLNKLYSMRATSPKNELFNSQADLAGNGPLKIFDQVPPVRDYRLGILGITERVILYLVSISFKLKLVFPQAGLRPLFNVEVDALINAQLIKSLV
jgi:hypothetical protein